MVTKPKQPQDEEASSSSRLFDSALAGQVKESAQHIWLAGMGAFARAQEEGSKVFEALVREGATLQKKTSRAAEEKFEDVSGRARGAQARAGYSWDKLESIFEERTAKALKRLGVPSSRDVEALSARVEALSAQVAKLSRPMPAKKTTAAKAPARKAAAKRATARKSAAARSA